MTIHLRSTAPDGGPTRCGLVAHTNTRAITDDHAQVTCRKCQRAVIATRKPGDPRFFGEQGTPIDSAPSVSLSDGP